jgi:dipeptidyl aminopeptidase/acylaminoacyl peptidase
VRAITVDDLMNLRLVSDAQIAPDGSQVAYVVSENGRKKEEASIPSRIWRVPFQGGGTEQVTFGPGADHSPRWSPDGRFLAFASDRAKRGTLQIYVLGQGVAEARRLTDLPQGAGDFRWSPDGERIATVVRDPSPEGDDDAWVFDQHGRYSRLHVVDVATGQRRPVAHGDLHIWEFDWSPDGREIAAIVSDEPFEWAWYSSRLVRIDIDTGAVTEVYRPERQIARPAWSPDGRRVALTTCRWSDPGMTGGDLLVIDPVTGDARNLTAGQPVSHLVPFWTPDGRHILTAAWEQNRAAVCRIDLDGTCETLWAAERSFAGYVMSVSASGERFAAALSAINEPADVWGGAARDSSEIDWRRLADSNPSLAEIATPGYQTMTWDAVDGLAIEGIYVAPLAASSEPPPMITLIHGGPTGAWGYAFPAGGSAAWIHLLAARGFAVFLPNPRGSNGYGVEFAEANIPDLGGGDWRDIEAGIDHCVANGRADPERLGVGGWSYGGYLSAWAVTQTARFKASVPGATITNWYSFHGGSNIPGFDEQYFGVDPQGLDTPYAWRSPLFFCDRVKTPTLLLHGERDECCPVGQALELARGLRRRGVTHQCVIYPREGHGFVETAHRRDMIERAVAWFEEHVR